MFLFKVLLLPEIEKEKGERLKAKGEKLFVTYKYPWLEMNGKLVCHISKIFHTIF